MKKSFKLTAHNKTPARQTDSVKSDIRKYIARERRKALPEGVDYWDFDCKMGDNTANSVVIHVSEINKKIDAVVLDGKQEFYIEVLVKPGVRKGKKTTDENAEDSTEEISDESTEDFEDSES